MADLLVYTCFRELFLKTPFFILGRLKQFSLWKGVEIGFLDSDNGFLDLENWFLEFGILKYWVLEHPNWHLGGFQEPLRARGCPPGAKEFEKWHLGGF